MKVGFYAPMKPPDHPTPSGDRRIARLIIRALETAGFTVEIMSTLRSWNGRIEPRDSFLAKAEQITQKALEEQDRLARIFEKKGPPDIWFTYHLYHKAPDLLGPTLCRTFDIPYCVAEASFAPKQETGPWASGHRSVAYALGMASAVFTLNPLDRACIQPLLKPDCANLDLPPFLDPNPYQTAKARREATRSELAREDGLDPDCPWIVVTAMMRDDVKLTSYKFLADALKDWTGPAFNLVLIGDGPARDQVASLFREYPCHITGLKDSDRVAEIQAACDLAVWPSIGEAFGFGVLEAQAAGLPVVSCENPGVAAMVQPGITAELTPTGDYGAFARAISAYLAEDEDRIAAGNAAAANVVGNHSLAAASHRLSDALNQLKRERHDGV